MDLGRITTLATLAGLLIISAPLSVWAADSVITKGRLSDRDFYRLVACAAPPGGDCQKKLLKWSNEKAKNLTLRITRSDAGFPEGRQKIVKAAIKNALAEINGLSSGVKLRLIARGKPDIAIVLTGHRISEGRPPARSIDELFSIGGAIAVAEVSPARGSSTIRSAKVIISNEVPDRLMKSVVLEEIVQSLGLLTDVHNRYYHNRSIFSETGSKVTQLRGQDAKAIVLHYPP